MNEADINFTKEAFLHPWNLAFLIVGMLTAFTISVFSNGPFFEITLLFAAAAELLYLGTMPRQDRFRRAIRAQRAAEHSKPPTQKEIFQKLSRPNQRRYARLRKLEKDIKANYQKLSYASQGMLGSDLDKINGLLDSYLNLLYQKERYSTTNRRNTENEVIRAIADLREDMTDDTPRVRSIKERRMRILEQRLARFKKGKENLEIIDAQLETIEDVTLYIHEQSLTLSNPEEITFQLDMLLSEVEATEAAVKEIEEVFSPSSDLLSDIDTFSEEEEEQEPAAQRDKSGLSG
jgi:hypothetical protein